MKKFVVHFALLFVLIIQAQEQPSPIHVTVTGQGKPLLLIPGFTVPGDSWLSVVDVLKKEYECHVVTLAGFGGTNPIGFPWLPQINKALEKYIDQNDLTNVTVMGHSLGGTLALWLASREHNQIEQLVIIDALPAAGALMFPNFNPEELVYESPYNHQLLAMTDEQLEQMAMGMAQGMSLNSATQQKIKEWIMMADRETYVFGYTDYLKLDMRKDLAKIHIPVTLIAADRPYGKEMVEQNMKSQFENLTTYDLIIATDAAHFVMFDQPEWFMEQIQGILLSTSTTK